MAIKMVREPSETPNINNIDDIVPMRYAYGGQNGYVIGKGTEISNTVNGLNFTVNSGRLVLQGVECDIDATGVTITIDNIATKQYYTVYLEVNLGLNTATIKSEYDTATYPIIDDGDDLTENTTGIARLPLYQFTATSGIIGEVNKVVEKIGYPLSDYNIENGTIEERLNRLGFKKGVVYFDDEPVDDTRATVYREGNIAILTNCSTVNMNKNVNTISFDNDFAPISNTNIIGSAFSSFGSVAVNLVLTTDGKIDVSGSQSSFITLYNIGWRIKE